MQFVLRALAINNNPTIHSLILVHILRDLGLPWQICKFFYNLTCSRSVYFNVGGVIQGPFETLKGVPQGCCTSPVAYNIYTHKLPNHIDPDCQYLCFADDVALFVSSPDLNFCTTVLQNSLITIASYFDSLGLSIAPEKTQLITFSRKQTDTSEVTLTFGDTIIHSIPQVKLLGVTFDSKLSWTPHYQSLIQKGTRYTNLIRSLCGTWWGGNPQSLIQTLREKLGVTQRRALRSCLGLRRSTPNRIVYAESCELPVSLRPKKLAMQFVLRALAINNNPTIHSLESLLTLLRNRNILNLLELLILRAYARLKKHRSKIHSSDVLPCYTYSLESQSLLSKIIISKGQKIKSSPNPPRKFSLLFRDLLTSSIAFYANGSKSSEGSYVGIGIYCPDLDLNLRYRIFSYALLPRPKP
ncbi:hypothetical protein TSAR_006855 [Trichomalopsis sarcophagae]|uniref:Reverse transcriptase domain-containing protein n=1 Tax=Trichomalopsis sarcophagae TaxID=543379 RepID=A0A232F8Q7_9HYME|nr:hypothetical protein TSAR_006855 [Trichomalopsis sarcophagae]